MCMSFCRNESQHVAIKLGHLSLTTTEDQSEQKNKICQIYDCVLKGIRILFQETGIYQNYG